MTASESFTATILLVLLALALSLISLSQLLASYTAAYLAAPAELPSFLDAIDSSVQENEAYDRDISHVPRLEDKLRLGRLLREIQRAGDDLREAINAMMTVEGGTRMRASTRLLWASKRRRLREQVDRLDMLRTRFLVIYLGIIAAKTSETKEKEKERDAEKQLYVPKTPPRPAIGHAQTVSAAMKEKKRPPLRRLTTQAMGHDDAVGQPHRMGWAGVVHELQMSPLMQKRHASIETAMRSPKCASPTD